MMCVRRILAIICTTTGHWGEGRLHMKDGFNPVRHDGGKGLLLPAEEAACSSQDGGNGSLPTTTMEDEMREDWALSEVKLIHEDNGERCLLRYGEDVADLLGIEEDIADLLGIGEDMRDLLGMEEKHSGPSHIRGMEEEHSIQGEEDRRVILFLCYVQEAACVADGVSWLGRDQQHWATHAGGQDEQEGIDRRRGGSQPLGTTTSTTAWERSDNGRRGRRRSALIRIIWFGPDKLIKTLLSARGWVDLFWATCVHVGSAVAWRPHMCKTTGANCPRLTIRGVIYNTGRWE